MKKIKKFSSFEDMCFDIQHKAQYPGLYYYNTSENSENFEMGVYVEEKPIHINCTMEIDVSKNVRLMETGYMYVDYNIKSFDNFEKFYLRKGNDVLKKIELSYLNSYIVEPDFYYASAYIVPRFGKTSLQHCFKDTEYDKIIISDISTVTDMSYAFHDATKLSYIKMGGKPSNNLIMDFAFTNLPSEGIFDYDSRYETLYKNLIFPHLPSTWTKRPF